ncbi:MAG TPA: LemA family protein [Candidatus Paceibacterota bacterium]|nr:LemA family protein [Candidatus Paceibacterota bacterium]
MSPLTILLAVIALIAVAVIVFYNRFVRLVNQAKEAWSDIEVQLKRRYDLIPNLINTVKGYASHEQVAFEKVTEARARAMSAGETATKEHAEAENMLTGALKSVFAIAEAYPDLKANTNFIELQRELSDTENKIQSSRRFYNSTVRDLNIAVESFPANVIAKSFGFAKMELFDLPENDEAQKVPEVKF